ncbi:uncharacterized protein LOC124689574 [Lolium rigidum]|uniref:uncharacterized protein LOC124689574 n=1 Tax=Lolium rigidum TaxID=89674 RepID=UPI001F5D85AE|nr:uncharacterized protein LOC124689574 [Lolium rigidum]
MTTASLHRRSPSSPAASPLDDDDLLREILLRLPPQPSSLPRASAVCKRWLRLAADPGFFRRFRRHHNRNPPLLGFFNGSNALTFVPTLKSPNSVDPGRFSLPSGLDDCFHCFGCRHGLVLIFLRTRVQVLVWDPVTGDQHCFAIPPGIARYAGRTLINGAVLRAAGDVQHFKVVLAMTDGDQQHTRVLACVYSSRTGSWGNLVSVPLLYKANGCLYPTLIDMNDAVLAGDSLYWVLVGNSYRILEFDLVKQSLDVIQVPADMCGDANHVRIMRAEGGGLGVLLVSSSYYTLQLWKRNTDCDGVTSWGLGKTIALDKLLSLKSEEKVPLGLRVLGYGEDNNVLFAWTVIGVFMIHLKSMKFEKLFEAKTISFSRFYPFESVYSAADTGYSINVLVVDMAELRLCAIRKMTIRLDMLVDLLIEQVSSQSYILVA